MKKIKNYFKGGPRNFFFLMLILLLGIAVLTKLTDFTRQRKSIAYSTFLKAVEQDQIKSVHIIGQEILGVFKDGTFFETVVVDNPKNIELLKSHNVDFSVAPVSTQFNFWHILLLLAFIGAPIAIWLILRQTRGSSGGGHGNIFSMTKSKAKMFLPSQIKVNFNSVAGVQEAKEELTDVVDFLKNPEKYRRLGAKLTRGILLVGEPGNGKTLLAKAVAGEANCPFFSISGSDFIEVFVGVGAARVRDLFAQARKHAPCIIFIDEIDAVGRQRGSGLGGGHDEREQTLNQLLTEMDGFESANTAVVVMAATNRPDVLDKALLRPGRFDRTVHVPYPDLAARESILKVHARDVKIAADVDFHKIARATPGFTGADLMNLINEAAIIASKTDALFVTMKDIEEARDKIMLGKAIKSRVLSEDEKRKVAFHEAGHSLAILLQPETSEPLHKVTIVPRGGALGITHWLPEKERFLTNKEQMLATITTSVGGRAAEEITFNVLSTGAHDDFKKATELAREMVCKYGMSEKLGHVVYKTDPDAKYSEHTLRLIEEEIKNIVDVCYKKALELLKTNKDKLDLLANTLIEKETLYAGEIYQLLGISPREEHRLI
ncbi:ATP-dependent zinc metalloprotease FtsH [Candidatus Dependentiae bacterium]|nr:ATP-dependent zinc metalloprotease FtsH [Candidatus Dependentiae bacterium]